MATDKLNKLLNYAVKNIPYYRSLSIKGEVKIEDFPIMTKKIIRENYTDLLNLDLFSADMFTEYTSGTTGIPLKCVKSKEEMLFSRKKIWKWRSKYVKDIFHKKMFVFSDDIMTMSDLSETGEHLRDHYYGSIDFKFITARDLQEKDIKSIVDYITNYDPTWIRSTPSNLYYFCKKAKNIISPTTFKNVEFIEVLGETLEDYHVEMFNKLFKCHIGNHYGCTEVWPIACQCKQGLFHVFEDHVYCETVNDDHYEGNVGELCITSLNQYYLPYIRYNLGDLVTLEKINCNCGVSGIVINNLAGRVSDKIIIDDKYYSPEIFSRIIKKAIKSNIIEPNRFIIVGESKNRFTFYIEQEAITNNNLKEFIDYHISNYISKNIDIEIMFCKTLPVPLSNKNKLFIRREELQ